MKKFYSFVAAALIAASAMAETEYLQSSIQGAKNEASVATSFTIAGGFNPGPGATVLTLGDYSAKSAKLRTNQEGNTLTLAVNEGMEITGINAVCSSNYAGTNVIITSILADGVEVLSSSVTATHLNNLKEGEVAATFTVADFSAKESVVFSFTNEEIAEEGKGTQLNILAEVTYNEAGDEEPNANDAAMELFSVEYESLSQQFTMVYNVIAAGENEAIVEEYITVMNGIYQNMATLQLWAGESYEAGTLANDLDEILGQFEGIQIQLTQCLNSYNEAVEAAANDAAMEQFSVEYESLSQQFTMVYNVIAAGENEAIVEEYITVMNGIYQNMATLQLWAGESYEAGTLAKDLDEILSQFEGIQIQLTQCLNSYNEAVEAAANAAANDAAMEQFFFEYESLSQQFTMVYNVIAAGENEAIVEEYITVMNGIYQNMAILQGWAEESYKAGTLANDLDEILSQFEGIQIQLTQCLNSYNDAVENTPVGVRAIAAEKNAKMFDLQGRRVNNANGIVIMNGKKAIIK